jgi:hypothetical protein
VESTNLNTKERNKNMTGSQITTELSRIIDSLIMDANPQVLDDDLPDLMADPEEREQARQTLLKMIEFYKEDL